MSTKTSADYQREFRRRLRDKGLVKKDVWILPEHAEQLAVLEKQLRIKQCGAVVLTEPATSSVSSANTHQKWDCQSLYHALRQQTLFNTHKASIEYVEGINPAIYMVMDELGGLQLFLSVNGEQIIVESVLWPQSAVADDQGFNEAILRTHKYFPLSTISLERAKDGVDYYMMFGALSSSSLLANIVFEIEVLAENVVQAAAAYADYLVVDPTVLS